MNELNLVKLHTTFGPMWIDTNQLNGGKMRFTIYTAKGKKLCDVARTKKERDYASCGVHWDYLFASLALANQAQSEVYARAFGVTA